MRKERAKAQAEEAEERAAAANEDMSLPAVLARA